MPNSSELEQKIDFEISKMHSVKHQIQQQVILNNIFNYFTDLGRKIS
jgi:hypothetical protein